jgi:hypothetical protein
MQNIKVYNIGEYIKKVCTDKCVHYHDKLAIIHSDTGCVVFDYEGVGWKPESIEEKVTMGVVDAKFDGISIVPQYTVDLKVKDLLTAEYKEMPLTQFLTKYKYNCRCTRNFNDILKTITEIGLNPDDYYIEESKDE